MHAVLHCIRTRRFCAYLLLLSGPPATASTRLLDLRLLAAAGGPLGKVFVCQPGVHVIIDLPMTKIVVRIVDVMSQRLPHDRRH